MKTNIKVLVLGGVVAAMCAIGCAKQDQLIEAQSDKVSLVDFIPQWSEGSVSKATAPALGGGRRVTLAVAKRAAAETPKPITSPTDFTVVNKKYVTTHLSNNTSMLPNDEKKLTLGTAGTYDFYAIADNASSDGKDLTIAAGTGNSIMTFTGNPCDYIGAVASRAVVLGTDSDMGLPFKHLMSKVKLVFTLSPLLQSVTLTSVSLRGIENSNAQAKDYLYVQNGALEIANTHPATRIVGSTVWRTMTSCGIDGEISYYLYYYPFTTDKLLEVGLSVSGTALVAGASSPVSVSAGGGMRITLNNGAQWLAGKEYVYKVSVKMHEMVFMNDGAPEVNDWSTEGLSEVVLTPSDIE